MALSRSDVDKLPESARRNVLAQLEPRKAAPPAVAGTELVVTLRLPPKELKPNSRVCWQAKARAAKEYRYHAYITATWAGSRRGTGWPRCHVQLHFYFAQRRRRDPDNLLAWMKSAFDGFTDAGIWTDDCGLTHLPPVVDVDRDNPRVEIIVRAAGG